MRRARLSRRRHRFAEGDVLQSTVTGKVFVVESITHPDEGIGSTWYLRSEAGHLGRPKSAWFLDNQIEDGLLKKLPKRMAPKIPPPLDYVPVQISNRDLERREAP